jgi:hypothetical protein
MFAQSNKKFKYKIVLDYKMVIPKFYIGGSKNIIVYQSSFFELDIKKAVIFSIIILTYKKC